MFIQHLAYILNPGSSTGLHHNASLPQMYEVSQTDSRFQEDPYSIRPNQEETYQLRPNYARGRHEHPPQQLIEARNQFSGFPNDQVRTKVVVDEVAPRQINN